MTAIEEHPYKVTKQANTENTTTDIEENTHEDKSFSTGILDVWEEEQVEGLRHMIKYGTRRIYLRISRCSL